MNEIPKPVRYRFYIYSFFMVVVIISFFAYMFTFDLFGKKFDELSSKLYYSTYLWIIVFVVSLFLYTKFLHRVSAKKKK